MKKKRSLWVSLLSVVAIAVIALSATLAAGWSPKLGLDLDGGLAVVYQTARPVTQAQLDTIVTILNDRVNAGTTGASVASQGKNQISVSIPGEKNTQQVLATLGNTAQLFFRPALCYAPALTLAKGKAPTTGPLPSCAATSALTEANLQVTPDSSSVSGYTYNTNIPPDGQFATYASTPSSKDAKNDTVLLPASAGNQGPPRYVVGPAELTGTAVKSASAQLDNGQWAVDLNLTAAGATKWNTFAQAQFHEIIAIDLDGQIISAPITQPSQSSFTSFGNSVQISGSFTENQAKTLATQFTYGALPVKLDRLTVETVSPSLGKSSLAGRAHLRARRAGAGPAVHHLLLPAAGRRGGRRTGRHRAHCCGPSIAFMGESLNTTIDLAGIIGLIVSIGITVDSYIVYFERLKDETRSGRTVRTSVDRGFASAFRTVLAADAVSLLGRRHPVSHLGRRREGLRPVPRASPPCSTSSSPTSSPGPSSSSWASAGAVRRQPP